MASTIMKGTPSEEHGVAVPNPRTARSAEKLEQAKELIAEELGNGGWVSSAEIHRKLGDRIAEGTFGRAKAAPDIEHRRVREDGRGRYEWRMKPKPAPRARKAAAKAEPKV